MDRKNNYVIFNYVMICRTEDFLDRMAVNPQTGTSVEYTVCCLTFTQYFHVSI